jgi:hypothetical protein
VTVVQILELAAAAMVAGAMNAVAGGGTLVTFPTLILTGTGSEVANATSTLALVFGTCGSMFGYREHIGAIRAWLARFWLVSAVGGFLGAVLLTRTSETTFSKMVPFLILFATLLFMAQDAFRRIGMKQASAVATGGRALWGAMAFQFAVSVYGGFFGAGIGILMLATLGFLGMKNIHEMNAPQDRARLAHQCGRDHLVYQGGAHRLDENGHHDGRRAGGLLFIGPLCPAHPSAPGAAIDFRHRLHDFRRDVLQAVCEIARVME